MVVVALVLSVIIGVPSCSFIFLISTAFLVLVLFSKISGTGDEYRWIRDGVLGLFGSGGLYSMNWFPWLKLGMQNGIILYPDGQTSDKGRAHMYYYLDE